MRYIVRLSLTFLMTILVGLYFHMVNMPLNEGDYIVVFVIIFIVQTASVTILQKVTETKSK